ncbi:MAG: beta-propeller domain-containing protein, partial [Verrucomicrobiales bacterium]|nr:beta-propeller domain-containing protein [Verrucomicrobiales bacterium]
KPHIRARKAWWTPALAVLSWLPIALGAATAPRITSIDVARDDLVISAEAPEGVLRLVLEGAERGEFRSWRPRAVQRVANPGPVTFRLPLNLAASLRVEMFRVRADTNDPLPAAFYTGKTQFAGEAAPAGSAILFRGNDGSEWVVDNAVPGAPTSTPPPASSPQRNVAESDIWRLHGDRLYFFNHQRGLQIVDVSQPDKPTLLATFPLPASGEQMYLLGDRHVVLLARSHPCDEGWGMNAKSAAILIDVSGDQPREAARIPLEGRILESRLVGSALYVATDTWQIKSDRPEDAGAWINGTRLVGIDLADPAKPAAHESVWLPGSGNVVTATERFLMVGTQTYDSKQWWQSRLHLLDIEDPSGSIRPFAELTLDGRLQDKFKVDVNGNILTTITAGPSNADGTGPWRSTLATYRLADPAAAGPLSVVRLGSVEVGHGEQLYATRFDGQRAYLVTFRQIDPLWIIDLSQPEQPRVLGELEIPGWSTYMYPMGDRLLTVGFDNTVGLRAAVQLFDVSNPAKPALLSKVPLGKEWSWSEANSDEKALGVFPASGLVLVPFSSSAGNQQVLGVQLIDLGRDSLVARGQIENPNVVPRRTSVAGDRVFAVSARDLVSVDIADRDHPSVRARLELSYPVERVVAAGSWLVEVSGSRLRSRAAGDAGDPRAELELKPIPVLGAALRDGRILVLQGRSAETIWQNDQWITNNPAAIRLTLIDAAKLPALEVLGTVEHPVEFWASGDYEALWPEANLVVWSPVSQSTPWYYFRGGPVPIDLAPTPALTDALPAVPQITAVVDAGVSRASIELGPGVSFAAPDIAILPGWRWWQPSAQPLFAFDVADPASPRFASKIPAPEGGFTQSRAAAAPGMIYFGYDTQETRITGTNTYVNVISQPVTVRREVLVTNVVEVPYETVVTNIVAKEFWVSAWELATPVLAPVAAGTLHAVGLDARGQAYGWGDNRAGQLGSFTSVNSEVPIAIPFPGFVTSVAAAKWFSLARLSSGAV